MLPISTTRNYTLTCCLVVRVCFIIYLSIIFIHLPEFHVHVTGQVQTYEICFPEENFPQKLNFCVNTLKWQLLLFWRGETQEKLLLYVTVLTVQPFILKDIFQSSVCIRTSEILLALFISLFSYYHRTISVKNTSLILFSLWFPPEKIQSFVSSETWETFRNLQAYNFNCVEYKIHIEKKNIRTYWKRFSDFPVWRRI